MGFRTVCECDACGVSIDATDKLPAKVNVYPPTSREIGHQQDEHQLCDACWEKLCITFPKFKEAERFAKPSPAPTPQPQLPSVMDTWTAEQVLVALADKLGVKIKQTPDE